MDMFVQSSAEFSWDFMLHRLWLRGVDWLGNLLRILHFMSQNLFYGLEGILHWHGIRAPRWCSQVIALGQ